MSVADIVTHVTDVDGFALAVGRTTTPSQQVASILRWQVARGTAHKVARGRYAIDVASLPSTSRWRIEHWDRLDEHGRLGR